MLLKQIKWYCGLFAATIMSAQSSAFECRTYDEVTAKLDKKYGEQLMFNGFTDSDSKTAANAIYEFWANPGKGNWSLIARKLFLFQHKTGVFSKSCVFIVNSGKQYYKNNPHPLLTDNTNSDIQVAATEPTKYVNCIPRDRHARALKERYDEEPFVHALTDDETIVEIYGSDTSWTITRAKIREVRSTMTGRPLMDESTGQHIHQLCSDPAFSGKTWGQFAAVEEHI